MNNKKEEIWLPLNTNIPLFSDIREKTYFVSNYGKVANAKKELTMDLKSRPPGVALLKKSSGTRKIGMNIIVALTFMYRADYESHTVINLDGNKTNNYIDNLVWDDYIVNNNMVQMCCPIPKIENIIECLPGEVWAPVPPLSILEGCDINGMFISTYGRAYSLRINAFIGSEVKDNYTYLRIKRPNYDNDRYIGVHILVMSTFTIKPKWDHEVFVNHKDGNKHNNRLDNLEWCTPKYNIHHAYSHNLSRQIGANHSESTISSEAVHMILDLYLNKKMSNEEILNNTPDNIRKTFISDILSCRSRLVDIIDYLTSVYGLESPYDVISKEDIDKIMECVDNGLSVTKTREFLNVEPNTIQFIVVGVLHYMVKHKTEWLCNGFIDHADLNMNMI